MRPHSSQLELEKLASQGDDVVGHFASIKYNLVDCSAEYLMQALTLYHVFGFVFEIDKFKPYPGTNSLHPKPFNLIFCAIKSDGAVTTDGDYVVDQDTSLPSNAHTLRFPADCKHFLAHLHYTWRLKTEQGVKQPESNLHYLYGLLKRMSLSQFWRPDLAQDIIHDLWTYGFLTTALARNLTNGFLNIIWYLTYSSDLLAEADEVRSACVQRLVQKHHSKSAPWETILQENTFTFTEFLHDEMFSAHWVRGIFASDLLQDEVNSTYTQTLDRDHHWLKIRYDYDSQSHHSPPGLQPYLLSTEQVQQLNKLAPIPGHISFTEDCHTACAEYETAIHQARLDRRATLRPR